MDHIPVARNDPYPHDPRSLDVPYLQGAGYIYGSRGDIDFLGLPESQGFVFEPVANGGSTLSYINQKSWRDTVLFIQEWAFFALLEEVYCLCDFPDFTRDEFIRSEGDRMFLTTKRISVRALEWELRRRNLAEDDISHPMEQLNNYIIAVNRHLKLAFPEKERPNRYREYTIEGDLIPLSAAALSEYLYGWVTRHDLESRYQRPSPGALFNSSFVEDRMLTGGWCPNEITDLQKTTGNVGCMILASSLDRKALCRAHVKISHEDTTCQCEQVDEKHYETLHTLECQGCPKVSETAWDKFIQEVRKFIQGGSYPLVTVESDESGGAVQLKLTASLDGPRYVAISHIWADGLGNPIENKIPSCQLRRLQRFADGLLDVPNTSHVPFWLDTICVPLDAITRKLAITAMRKIYQDAAVVLVLDATISRVNFYNERPEASLMRVAFSRWTTRMWTCQEGLLAKRLFFQFKDGPAELPDLRTHYWDDKHQRSNINVLDGYHSHQIPHQQVRSGAADPFFHSGHSRLLQTCTWDLNPADPEMDGLRNLYWRLSQRRTSKDKDEAALIATLLDIDVRTIQAILDVDDPGQRMQRLFLSLKTVPAEFLFFEGPRCLELGRRWIPRSFLRPKDTFVMSDRRALGDQSGTVTDNGLIISAPGARFHLRDGEDVQGYVWLAIGNDNYTVQFYSPAMTEAWGELRNRDLGLIFEPSNRFAQVGFAGSVSPIAALVAIQPTLADMTTVRFEAVIRVYKRDPDLLLRAGLRRISGEPQPNILWCIA